MEVYRVKLKRVMLINAGFSGITGLSALLFQNFISVRMGITQSLWLPVVGLILILFAGFVTWTALQKKVRQKAVYFIVFQDVLWVLGSILILLNGWLGLSNAGNIMVSLIAVLVGALAWVQFRYMNRVFRMI